MVISLRQRMPLPLFLTSFSGFYFTKEYFCNIIRMLYELKR